MYNPFQRIFGIAMSMGPLIIVGILISAFKKSMRKSVTAKRQESNEPPATERKAISRIGEDVVEFKPPGKWMTNASDCTFIEDKENDWLARQMREEDRLLRISGKQDVIESRLARRNYTAREEYSD